MLRKGTHALCIIFFLYIYYNIQVHNIQHAPAQQAEGFI